MALITRVSRLFAADINAIIDQIEEPELLLKQSLREMQETLAASEQRLSALKHQLTQLDEQLAQTKHRHVQIEEELDVCLAADNDELARAVIRRQLQITNTIESLVNQQSDVATHIAAQQQLAAEQKKDLSSTQQKANLLTPTPPGTAPPSDLISQDQVEVALLKEKQRRKNR